MPIFNKTWHRAVAPICYLAVSSLTLGSNLVYAQSVLPLESASQSSTNFGGVATRAIDGSTDGVFVRESVTHTKFENKAWWSANLEKASNISDIQIWNRTNCCASRLSDFYILVSSNPFESTDLETTLDDVNVWSEFHSGPVGENISIPVGVKGQYVRIQMQGKKALSLAEVVVLGTPASVAPQAVEHPSYGFNFVNYIDDDVENDGLFGWTTSGNATLVDENEGLDAYLRLSSESGSPTTSQYNDFGYFRPNETDFTATINLRASNLLTTSSITAKIGTGAKALEAVFNANGTYVKDSSGVLQKVADIVSATDFETFSFEVRDGRLEKVFINDDQQLFTEFDLPAASERLITLTALVAEQSDEALGAEIDDLFVYSRPSRVNLLQANNNAGSADQATHFMHLGIGSDGVPIGVNADGGGYITQVYNKSDGLPVEESSNLGEFLDPKPQFGAGTNQSVRGRMHANRYNPVQAGISIDIGHSANVRTLTSLDGEAASNSSETGVIKIDQFATYNDPTTEYAENSLYEFKDNGNSIWYTGSVRDPEKEDFLNEVAVSASEEGLTELDFNGHFKDVSTDKTPVMLSYGEWKYVRPPSHILQLSRESGSINSRRTPSKISKADGRNDLKTRDTDLGSIRIMREIRANHDFGYSWVLWKENGVEMSRQLTGSMTDIGRTDESMAIFELLSSNTKKLVPDDNIVILGTSSDWDADDALGIYYPEDSEINQSGTVGYNRGSHELVYDEDRRTSVEIHVDWRKTNWVRLRLLSYSRGLFSPSRVDDVYEGFRSENYTLFGTANEIYNKALELSVSEVTN